jgi:site-specific DNA-methyltransferase (adenine-specific)
MVLVECESCLSVFPTVPDLDQHVCIPVEKWSMVKLKAWCKANSKKGYSSKKQTELVALIRGSTEEHKEEHKEVKREFTQEIRQGDCLEVMKTLSDHSCQIIICDPPYNIGKDFGNESDKQPMDEYLKWCDKWISECLRVLKPNGSMFIYGFSEILALITARIPMNINRRWLVWHYTNKNMASLNFWQRSHESILLLWKSDKVFHRDEIREPYTEGFLNGAAGKERVATKGRFSKGDKKTTYQAHPGGALPRDVIKIPALAGGAGMKERVDHPTQKPLALCEKLLKSCKQDDGLVLVPFAGSGSECLAAQKLEMSFLGIELNPEYVELIHKRLENV